MPNIRGPIISSTGSSSALLLLEPCRSLSGTVAVRAELKGSEPGNQGEREKFALGFHGNIHRNPPSGPVGGVVGPSFHLKTGGCPRVWVPEAASVVTVVTVARISVGVGVTVGFLKLNPPFR